MAEIEFRVLSRSCLKQHLPDDDALRREAHALVQDRSAPPQPPSPGGHHPYARRRRVDRERVPSLRPRPPVFVQCGPLFTPRGTACLIMIMGGLEAPINSPAATTPRVLNKHLAYLLNRRYYWT